MTSTYKEQCINLVMQLEEEITTIQIENHLKIKVLNTIHDFLKVNQSKVDGAVVALKFNEFVLEFGRYLWPGGIVLTSQAKRIWNEIMELFNSTQTRGKIQPFAFSKK